VGKDRGLSTEYLTRSLALVWASFQEAPMEIRGKREILNTSEKIIIIIKLCA
jgi:hypothetical protein